jgi:hypothetical protein
LGKSSANDKAFSACYNLHFGEQGLPVVAAFFFDLFDHGVAAVEARRAMTIAPVNLRLS